MKPRCINTYADLLERLTPRRMVGQAEPCQVWSSGVNGDGRAVARVVGAVYSGQAITARALGLAGLPGMRWVSCCGDPMCLAREHLVQRTHGQVVRAAAARGAYARNQEHIARRTATMISNGKAYPLWMREWAMESSQTHVDVAAALGVDPSTVGVWRRTAANGVRGRAKPLPLKVDPRYRVAPGQLIEGAGFLSDWLQKRASNER